MSVDEGQAADDAAADTAAAPPHPGLFDIIDIAGKNIEIYSYLQPQELCWLSQCNRKLLTDVKNNRNVVLRSCLPIRMVDSENNDEIFLAEGQTFTEKEEIHEFMVQRFDRAGILVRETKTREHSIERARYLLQYQNYCHLTLPEHTFNALAECHIDEIDAEYAKTMIGWGDCRNVMQQNPEAHQYAMNWARYLLSDPDAEATRWNWVSNHPNFKHQSVRGTGIVISTPDFPEKIEVRWDRKFLLKGSIFESNLHRRVPLPPQRDEEDSD